MSVIRARYTVTAITYSDGAWADLRADSTGRLVVAAQSSVAHDAAESENPIPIGGIATGNTAQTAVAANDRVRAAFGLNGQVLIGVSGASTVAAYDGSTTLGVLLSGGGSATFLATQGFVYNGTNMVAARGDTNGTVVQSGLSATFWNYAAATGGIDNTTTAVTIKAAAGASVRNYLKTLTISHDTLGAATEIAIRDGAGGTVLWRGKLQTTAVEDSTLTFDPPLKGTANTLLEVVTLTAVTGDVLVNATGFTGT